jgi:glycosyltransferase involved in cell wall biosynthesis
MSAPLFSVVIPTFDRAGYVLEALESVLAQTRADFEVIVVDDGSTDDTAERLAPHLDRIVYVRQPNAGQAAAKNRGVRQATGRYVGFLDSDDRWEPRTLEAVAAELEKHPDTGLLSIRIRDVEADRSPTPRTHGKRTAGPLYTTAGLLGRDVGACSVYFVRRDLLERVGGFDESLRSAEECDLALRLSFVTTLRALPEPLLLRRLHAGNLSRDMKLNAKCWIRLLEKLARDRPDFVARNRRLYRRALAKERLRFGRELLATEATDRDSLRRARRQLWSSLTTNPFSRRAPVYLAWSLIAPTTYARFRTAERKRGRS